MSKYSVTEAAYTPAHLRRVLVSVGNSAMSCSAMNKDCGSWLAEWCCLVPELPWVVLLAPVAEDANSRASKSGVTLRATALQLFLVLNVISSCCTSIHMP